MVVFAASFIGLMLLPVDFSYLAFAMLIAANGIGTGTFASPKTLTSGLQRQGVAHSIAHHVGTLPPVSSLFAAVLGVNPLQHLLAPSGALSKLPAAAQQTITGREFFPHLIRAGSGLKASDDQIGAVELTASPGVEPPMHVHRHEDEWYSEHP